MECCPAITGHKRGVGRGCHDCCVGECLSTDNLLMDRMPYNIRECYGLSESRSSCLWLRMHFPPIYDEYWDTSFHNYFYGTLRDPISPDYERIRHHLYTSSLHCPPGLQNPPPLSPYLSPLRFVSLLADIRWLWCS